MCIYFSTNYSMEQSTFYSSTYSLVHLGYSRSLSALRVLGKHLRVLFCKFGKEILINYG